MWYCKWTIMSGRGEQREVIRFSKNLEATDRADALAKMGTWVHGLISAEFLAGEDVRSTYEASYGAGDTMGV